MQIEENCEREVAGKISTSLAIVLQIATSGAMQRVRTIEGQAP